MANVPKNTTHLLQKLRFCMSKASPAIQAYIVPSVDAHNSEYIASCDARRAFISGFTGSSGTAVITSTKAALWTDGRYFLQASMQLDENWVLMKQGLPDTPTQAKWLLDELAKGSSVGVDPELMTQLAWDDLVKNFKGTGIKIVATTPNLIDCIWVERPERPKSSIIIQPLEYTGKSWQDKVKEVRRAMLKEKAALMIVSALDDVAWLLNLRGFDVTFNPVFFSYVFVTHSFIHLCVDEDKLNGAVREHLNSTDQEFKVSISGYHNAIPTLSSLLEATKNLPQNKVWLSPLTNVALFNVVSEERQLRKYSEVAVMKSVKNHTELQGFRNCHVRDGVALCEFLWWLEEESKKGGVVSEIQAANHLEACRKKQGLYVSLSFDTISSTGSNAAIIHYKPSEEKTFNIDFSNIYLVDSGAQYRDGTTDVTRTVHINQASQYQKECFTRVLKGYISLHTTVFPNNIKGLFLDSIARLSLWREGLDYRHGTSHGVGSFLNVHEGPMGIACRIKEEDVPLKEGMVLSIEPGFYENGQFGLRIENLVEIVRAQTKHNFQDTGFLTFEALTLAPIQPTLILKELLTPQEISWINSYHSKVRHELEKEMKKQKLEHVISWLHQQTQAI